MRFSRRSRTTLAWEIGIALVLKFCLIYVIWGAWFSQPAAKHMRMDDNAVARALLFPGPVQRADASPEKTSPARPD